MVDRIEAVIGVDVGGTNTDAVILQTNCDTPTVISSAKSLTTADITSGIRSAITLAIEKREKGRVLAVQAVNIGTTHFVNAVVQRKDLTKVSVIRLCGSASRGVPPYADFPDDLARCIESENYFVGGGYNVDGSEISPVSEEEISNVVENSIKNGIYNFVVCGISSPIRNDQEILVKSIIDKKFPNSSVTLSHQVGQSGLIERENASILNESLKPLCKRTIAGFREALKSMNLLCPLFLTQNDGTVVGEDYALEHPICTFASGPTNSMRGAAFLSGVKDAVVVDIGGTTTDIGILKKGFPREASTEVKLGGVKTNFRMPDVYSFGLGGGSYIRQNMKNDEFEVKVGPRSSGFEIRKEAFVFRNNLESCQQAKMTATDLAVAAGLTELGNKENVAGFSSNLVQSGIRKIKTMVETAIDCVKLSAEPLPVIVVGGGGIILDCSKGLIGASDVIFPDFYHVANAVGAALSQISGSVDYVESLSKHITGSDLDKLVSSEASKAVGESLENIQKRARKMLIEQAVLEAKERAVQKATNLAVESGADRQSVTIFDKSDTPLAYLPGDATRIQCKVIGDLKLSSSRATVIDDSFILPEFGKAEHQETTIKEVEIFEEESVECFDRREPFINEKSEWILSLYDIECIAIGSGILGCGGGGSPHLGKILAKRAIREGKVIKVVDPVAYFSDKGGAHNAVFQPAYMGAPFALIEKLVSNEITTAMQCMIDLFSVGQYKDGCLMNKEGVNIEEENNVVFINDYKVNSKESLDDKQTVSAIMSAEIGGMNSIQPLLVGASFGLPVLDCDGMGRAFPELQMFSPLIYDTKPFPAVLADDKGRRSVALHTGTAKDLENFFRKVVVEMGCSGALMLPALSSADVLNKTVLFSLSRAWNIGNAVMNARKDKVDPVESVVKQEGGILLISGKIVDVRRETTGGFNRGFVHVAGLDNFSDQFMVIEFQNENLLARKVDPVTSQTIGILCCTPDLISIVDNENAEPIATEAVRYGMRVSVIAIPIPDIMKTPKALKVVGPQAFGYPEEVQYTPIGSCRQLTSVIKH